MNKGASEGMAKPPALGVPSTSATDYVYTFLIPGSNKHLSSNKTMFNDTFPFLTKQVTQREQKKQPFIAKTAENLAFVLDDTSMCNYSVRHMLR